MLTYLTGNVSPNIAMSVHQYTCFSAKPMQSHKQAATRIGWYLLGSKKCMIYTPDQSKGLKVYADANFVGGWDPENALDADTFYPRTGFIIRYASCPFLDKQTADRSSIIYFRSWIYCDVSSSEGGNSFGESHSRSWRHFKSSYSKTKVYCQGTQIQSIMHCDGTQSNVHTSNKAYCYQVSLCLEAHEVTVKQG